MKREGEDLRRMPERPSARARSGTLLLALTLAACLFCLGCEPDDDDEGSAAQPGATKPGAQRVQGRGLEVPEKGSGATWPSRMGQKKKTPRRGMDSLTKPPADPKPVPPEPAQTPGQSGKKQGT